MTKIVSVSQFKKLVVRYQHLHLMKHDFKDGTSRVVLYDYVHKDCLYATPRLSRNVADLLYSEIFCSL